MTNLDSISKSRAIAYKVPSIQIYDFSSTHVWIWELDNKKGWEPKNGAFELWCWRRLLIVPWTARRTSQSILKEILSNIQEVLNIHWRVWYWSRSSNTLATWCEGPTYWKRPWFWERLKAGREGDDKGWDDWMASPTQWTWVWANSGRWWRTGRPGMLQSIGSQRVRHNCSTEQQQIKTDNPIPWCCSCLLRLPPNTQYVECVSL